MNLNERIESVKPYFVLFNISAEEDAIYAVVRFPQTWTIPDRAALKKTYNVELASMNNGICFATETKNGAECVFDALDYVIKFNKCVEERKELLISKVNELKNLFATEDLEKLKTLTFVFEKPKKAKQGKKAAIETVQSDTEVDTQEESEQEVDNNEPTVLENAEDTALMAFAKNMTD